MVSQPFEILLKTERLVLDENIQTLDWKNEISPNEIVNGKIYRLIQFYEMPKIDLKQRIKKAGIVLLDFIPNKAYTASIPQDITISELKALNIRSVFKIKKEWKQSNAVFFQTFGSWAISKKHVDLSVRYFKNIKREYIVRIFEKKGIHVLKAPDFIPLIQVRVSISKIKEIIDLPFVSYVDQVVGPGNPEDDKGRSLHRNNLIDVAYPTGRHYDGEGVNILVRDDGNVGPHIDFHGRIDQQGVGFGGSHGDGVAGVAAGSGNIIPQYKGAASGAKLFVRPYYGDFLDETLELHQQEGVMITNSSYGDGCNEGYTSVTETVDLQVFQNPSLMHVFSAGNSGTEDCDYGAGEGWGNITGGHKQGKNVIATANLFFNGAHVTSSSRGPAHDGRIKPDISAHGQNQFSTDPENSYDIFGGTSGAAPCVMGTMAQLYQAFKELNNGTDPESALIKATILNTANDIENEGPDFRTGWGHLNAYRAIRLLEEDRYLSATIDQGDMNEHSINIPIGTKQVRFMLYWADEAATPMAGPALVNDLDLMVTDASSTSYLPWVLDPTPDPSTLGDPAGNGIDNLNNMEQVLINDPKPGDFQLSIAGSVVPNAAVKYFIVYEIIEAEDIKVVYPNGGESFVSGEVERIYWDAIGNEGEFNLSYSDDEGATWNTIFNPQGTERSFDWVVPNSQSGKFRIQISRGGVSDESEVNFSIGPIPQNLHITQVCPTYIRVEWDAMESATSFDLFRLGAKYMDSVGTTTDLFYEFPITDPFAENWFAIRAVGEDGFVSRRTFAINHSDDLVNCSIDLDVSNNSITEPIGGFQFACEAFEQNVTMVIQNKGLLDASSIICSYQLNNDPPVTEMYNNVLTNLAEDTFTFSTPLVLNVSGDYSLKTWITYSGDEAIYNDTLENNFSVYIAASPTIPEVIEDFETAVFPPNDWNILNADIGQTWEHVEVIGSDGNTTRAAGIYHYTYANQEAEDEFVSFAIDLSEMTAPGLTFDYAYATYSDFYSDSLRVDIFTACGSQYHSTIFGASYLDLATVGVQVDPWEPENSDDWRNESLDLSEVIGEVVVIKFIAVNGYGNNLFIDNIKVLEIDQSPEAIISASFSEVCVDSPITFQSGSTGFGNTYAWDFGEGANVSGGTGAGPFVIAYNTSGTKTITLTATNSNGTDITTQQIEVKEKQVPSFTYIIENDKVIFTNTTTNATSYFWNFGDGNSSTDENPTHIFQADGSFNIELFAQSENCSDILYSEVINIAITAIEEQELEINAAILPNPNNGNFQLKISDSRSREIEILLIDQLGRVVENVWKRTTQGEMYHQFDNNALTDGIYFVKIRNENEMKLLKMVVQ